MGGFDSHQKLEMLNGNCEVCGQTIGCIVVPDQEPDCCIPCSNTVKSAREQKKALEALEKQRAEEARIAQLRKEREHIRHGWMCHECTVAKFGERFEEKTIGGLLYEGRPCKICERVFPRGDMHLI